jgi:hypothetical protein
VLIDILSTFPDIMRLAELVASFIFMFKLLEVSIYRSQTCVVSTNGFRVEVSCHPRKLQ